jgi:hypothetical protein
VVSSHLLVLDRLLRQILGSSALPCASRACERKSNSDEEASTPS